MKLTSQATLFPAVCPLIFIGDWTVFRADFENTEKRNICASYREPNYNFPFSNYIFENTENCH